MDTFLTESLGIPSSVYQYFILPLLIFLARVSDVSIGTMRVIFVMSGKKKIAPVMGFLESFIWLLAIRQIFQNVDNILTYVAYAGGYGTGTFVGMYIEEKLALGRVVVRVITKTTSENLVNHLKQKEYRFANLDAEGNEGKVNVLFTVVKREHLPDLLRMIKEYNPQAFYTIEGIKRASDEQRAETKDRLSVLYKGSKIRV
ncbi:DUF2179 domain-containing protein [Cytophagales bacterium LB-30]|uniref:UPF0316 protein QWY31_03175 n=1 Tax=Shiella aurantiaca TaxID=3058365 RepID=A0ABT8F224_9BACT|nr:DUF2179 domain-containing protein [Shiella aurantiaca]MDN4164485.1 DUF2179 domain-containing protein [Shiella aurantiaca]